MNLKNLKKIKVVILAFVLIFSLSVNFVSAQTKTGTAAKTNCDSFIKWFNIKYEKKPTESAIGNLPQICTAQQAIAWAIQLLLLFAGSVAVIFIIVGGFRYLTSAGNEEAAEKGKKTLVTSIIGLVVIVLAATIVRIVATTLGTGSVGNSNPAQPVVRTEGLPTNENPGPPQPPEGGFDDLEGFR